MFLLFISKASRKKLVLRTTHRLLKGLEREEKEKREEEGDREEGKQLKEEKLQGRITRW